MNLQTKLGPLLAAAMVVTASCSESAQPQTSNSEGTTEDESAPSTWSTQAEVFGQSFTDALTEISTDTGTPKRATTGNIQGLSFQGVEGLGNIAIGGIYILSTAEARGANDFHCQVGDNVSEITIDFRTPESTMLIYVDEKTIIPVLLKELRERTAATNPRELIFTTYEVPVINSNDGDARIHPPCFREGFQPPIPELNPMPPGETLTI